jgi:hypothetical protein
MFILCFQHFSLKVRLTDMLKKSDFKPAIQLFEAMKVEFPNDPLFMTTVSENVENDVDDKEFLHATVDSWICQLKSIFVGK